MRAVVDDAVQERLALDALAHEPALHVGDRDDDRVDPALADPALELGEPRVLARRRARALASLMAGPPAADLGPEMSTGRRVTGRPVRCYAD